MDMLFPDPIYGDITQLNYWPVEENLRRVNVLVYKVDPTNLNLQAASNVKWEIGVNADWNGYSFSMDFFRENMTSGFRYSYEYLSVEFKRYDASAIDKSSLAGPPDLSGLPYRNDTVLTAYSFTTNGSRTLKKGIEFSFGSRRIKALNTKISANGAWFRTEYMNSQPEYYRPSVMIDGKSYPYIGIYDKNDGSFYDSLITNLMMDTQIPGLGLIFSTSFQCMWFSGYRSMPDSKYPDSYMDKAGNIHPFDADLAAGDAVLRHLIKNYTPSLFQYQRTPFAMNVNLKVMKKLYRDKVSCSLYVNKIFEMFPNSKLRPSYGSTEVCASCSAVLSREEFLKKPDLCKTVGRINANCEMKLVDNDGNEVPVGEVGEGLVRSPAVFRGYIKNEELNKRVLDNGWFHTEDLLRRDEDGFYYITGRKKNLIILDSGENVSPEELEKLLGKCADIKECIVKEMGKKIGAVICCEPEKEQAVRAFVTELNRTLPLYKRISAVECTAEPLPRNAMGKLLRR